MAGPNDPLPAPNELRASVFDAALQLGLLRDDRFAEWMFEEQAIPPENNVKPSPVEVPVVRAERDGEKLLGSADYLETNGDSSLDTLSHSANSSSASLNEHVKQLEEAYAALATTRLTRAASRKATMKAGGRTGPSHQVSQSEVLSFSREDAVAGSSSTLARSATFSSRSPNPLHIDSAKSNAPFITVTPARGAAATASSADSEVSYVSTVWGKELLQSYDIDLSSAPATPVSNSPFSKHLPLPSASPTNSSFTSSESSLLSPTQHQPLPLVVRPPISLPAKERDKLPATQQVPTDVTESPDTTPTIPPTPPLVVRKNAPSSPTSPASTSSGPFVPVTPSSTMSRLPSPPPTPYSAASPDSPTIPWMKSSALPPIPPPISTAQQVFPSSSRDVSPISPPTAQTSPRPTFFSFSKSTPPSTAASTPRSSTRQTPPQSPYSSLFGRLSLKRKSKHSTPAESRDASPLEPQFSDKELPPIPIPPSARAKNSSKALSSPDLNLVPRVPVPLAHVSMNPTVVIPPSTSRSATASPVSAGPGGRQQLRGRISPFPVKPIRKLPYPPSPASPTPQVPPNPPFYSPPGPVP